MIRLIITTLISFTLSFLIWNQKTSTTNYLEKTPKQWLVNSSKILTPKEHIRPGDQTFLTFPEWFLVHSPAEEARYLSSRTSTTFPFWSHVEQLWKSYYIVYDQIKENYELNIGYHVMILVIATSTTVEYGAKAIYEVMIGRITDTKPSETMTGEDILQAKITLDYVNFIRQTPWYEFDFLSALKQLWLDTPAFGNHIFRKWERRYFLTSDLAVKAAYGWMIKKATKAAYENPILGTSIVVDRQIQLTEKISLVQETEQNFFVYFLPRYADFNPTISEVAVNEAPSLFEVAGNSSAILVTALIRKDEQLPEFQNVKTIFVQDILTRPGERRYALVMKVPDLIDMLAQAKSNQIEIEHVYDF